MRIVLYQQQHMIGSLGDFIHLNTNSILSQINSKQKLLQDHPISLIKKRGKSSYETYTPTDKTYLLHKYQNRNVFKVNRKKNMSLSKEVLNSQVIRRPLYQHRSFFVKPEGSKDCIAKQQLKRKHNLLRAILRMKQSEQQPKGESDYEQSFQRLYSGFRNIHPSPVLFNQKQYDEVEEQNEKSEELSKVHIGTIKKSSNLSSIKRLQFERCLSWAKKHQKNGDYFAEQLGKSKKALNEQDQVMNRSLIEEIGRKLNISSSNE